MSTNTDASSLDANYKRRVTIMMDGDVRGDLRYDALIKRCTNLNGSTSRVAGNTTACRCSTYLNENTIVKNTAYTVIQTKHRKGTARQHLQAGKRGTQHRDWIQPGNKKGVAAGRYARKAGIKLS